MQYPSLNPFLFCKPTINKIYLKYKFNCITFLYVTLFVSSVIRASDFVQISLTDPPATQRSITAFKVPKEKQWNY